MFVVVFRDEFLTICQSFVVVVVCEGVMVCNPKIDSNSEFECLNTAEERKRCAGEAPWPLSLGMATPCGGRVPHGPTSPLVPCGTRAPNMDWAGVAYFCCTKMPFSPLPFKCFHLPPFVLKKKKFEIPSRIFSPIFSTSKHHNFLIRSRN